MLHHPARHHRLRGFLDPLIHQSRDFAPNIRGIVQSREFKTLQQRT